MRWQKAGVSAGCPGWNARSGQAASGPALGQRGDTCGSRCQPQGHASGGATLALHVERDVDGDADAAADAGADAAADAEANGEADGEAKGEDTSHPQGQDQGSRLDEQAAWQERSPRRAASFGSPSPSGTPNTTGARGERCWAAGPWGLPTGRYGRLRGTCCTPSLTHDCRITETSTAEDSM